MELVQYIFLILLMILSILLLLALLSRKGNDESNGAVMEALKASSERNEKAQKALKEEVAAGLGEQRKQLLDLMNRVDNRMDAMTRTMDDKLAQITDVVDTKMEKNTQTVDQKLGQITDVVDQKMEKNTQTVGQKLDQIATVVDQKMEKNTQTVGQKLDQIATVVDQKMEKNTQTVDGKLGQITLVTDRKLAQITVVVDQKMDKITGVVDGKLAQITGVVDQKLDETLNRRLDENFKQVGDQLGKLYQSLGELEKLSTGVGDLNRTLSNVKTRGVFGEVQLGRILAETMARSQYEENVATKHGSEDRVEFAVRFPAQDGSGDTVYLPIDAKFPSDIYNKIADASANGDQAALAAAQKELRGRIRSEAHDIREKYLDVPRTTAYAILFLPTEGLYAEVLRLDGLTEECQKEGVVVAGPTTITALLNSLQVGFRNIALSRKSVEIMRLLEAVKTQFGKMDDAIEKTRKKLFAAEKATDDMQKRTRIIQKQMHKIGELDEGEAKRILREDDDDVVEDEE
ncbi:MAG: DNA recombination protein RmuC [bacterium]